VPRPLVVLAQRLYHPAGEALLERHARLRVLESPTPAEVARACADAHALIARYPNRVDAALLDAAPGLVIVACSGRGTDAVDVAAASARGVAAVNNPGFGRRPVSEAAIGMILALAKRLLASDAWMRRGEGWLHRTDFSEFLELEGKTLGVVGFGEIGRETARKALVAFGMRVLAYDPHVPDDAVRALGAEPVGTLDALLARSDVVSLHPELNEATDGMIGDAQLRRMKPGAFLVNTSRGRVVQQAALLRALSGRWIAGAALDVYEDEPVGPDNPLLALDNLLLTPHVAGLSAEAVEGMSLSAARQVLQALGGRRPAHLLDPAAWPAAAARAAQSGFDPMELPK
jgi:phosphoglycerate dehydrogenase-like enzyme